MKWRLVNVGASSRLQFQQLSKRLQTGDPRIIGKVM